MFLNVYCCKGSPERYSQLDAHEGAVIVTSFALETYFKGLYIIIVHGASF